MNPQRRVVRRRHAESRPRPGRVFVRVGFTRLDVRPRHRSLGGYQRAPRAPDAHVPAREHRLLQPADHGFVSRDEHHAGFPRVPALVHRPHLHDDVQRAGRRRRRAAPHAQVPHLHPRGEGDEAGVPGKRDVLELEGVGRRGEVVHRASLVRPDAREDREWAPERDPAPADSNVVGGG